MRHSCVMVAFALHCYLLVYLSTALLFKLKPLRRTFSSTDAFNHPHLRGGRDRGGRGAVLPNLRGWQLTD